MSAIYHKNYSCYHDDNENNVFQSYYFFSSFAPEDYDPYINVDRLFDAVIKLKYRNPPEPWLLYTPRHWKKVCFRSHKYISRAFSKLNDVERFYWERMCSISGYAHEVLYTNMSWIQLCQISNYDIARIIASFTPDARLFGKAQLHDLYNRLSSADLTAHVVCLADLEDTVEYYDKMLLRGKVSANDENLAFYMRFVRTCLEAIRPAISLYPFLVNIADQLKKTVVRWDKQRRSPSATK